MNSWLYIKGKSFLDEVEVRNEIENPPSKVLNELSCKFREVLEVYAESLLTLDTYGEYDEQNDIQYIITFTVPKSWAEIKLQNDLNERGISLDEFMNYYTWDDVIDLYRDAEDEGVILEKEIKKY